MILQFYKLHKRHHLPKYNNKVTARCRRSAHKRDDNMVSGRTIILLQCEPVFWIIMLCNSKLLYQASYYRLHYRRKFGIRIKCVCPIPNRLKKYQLIFEILCLFPWLNCGQVVFTFQMSCSRILFDLPGIATGHRLGNDHFGHLGHVADVC